MRFAHPKILFFLFAVLVPVLIHLLKLYRYKREYFSNVRLLAQIVQERKRVSRLRERLVLLARMLTIAAMVLAFARPYIPSDSGDGRVGGAPAHVCIYLDNSFSMQAPSSEAVLLDKAKEQVERILEGFPADASVALITNAFSGKEEGFYTPAEVLRDLTEVGYSALPRDFTEVCEFQNRIFEAAGVPPAARLCYYVSDFQKSTFAPPSAADWGDSLTGYVFVPVAGVAYANISLDSVALEMPVLQAGREIGLRVFLSNRSGGEVLQVPLRLYVQGIQTGVYPVDFKPGERVSVQIPFHLDESGVYSCCAEIADYPIEFDNSLYFSFRVNPEPQVLHIFGEKAEPALVRLFGGDSAFVYRPVSIRNLRYEDIPASSFVILEGVEAIPSALVSALGKYVEAGGRLTLIPALPNAKASDGDAAEPPFRPLTQALLNADYGTRTPEAQRIRRINTLHPVFALALAGETDGNLLPEVKNACTLPESPRYPYTSLLSFSPEGARPQNDFLRVYAVGNGLLYAFAASLGEANGDFTAHYTYVVSLLNMALFQGSGPRLYYPAGTEKGIFFPSAPLAANSGNVRYLLKETQSGECFMPLVRKFGSETAFYVYGQIDKAGNYLLGTALQTDTSGFCVLQAVSFNYDRRESESPCAGPSEIAARVGGLKNRRCFMLDPGTMPLDKQVREMNNGRELWKVFLIFALVFAMAETLLLRGWRMGKK